MVLIVVSLLLFLLQLVLLLIIFEDVVVLEVLPLFLNWSFVVDVNGVAPIVFKLCVTCLNCG